MDPNRLPPVAPAPSVFFDPASFATLKDLSPVVAYIRARTTTVDHYTNLLKSIDPKLVQTDKHLQLLVAQKGLLATIDSQPKQLKSSADMKQTLRTIVIALNIMNQEILTGALVINASTVDDLDKVLKIGTEFSFSAPELLGLEPDVPSPAQKAAVVILEKWKAAVLLKYKSNKTFVSAPASKPKCNAAVTFYPFGKGGWNWTLDLDDSCVETQTQPSTVKELQADDIEAIITTDIFALGSKQGVKPDESVSGGSGHISLDALTLCGNSAEACLDLLALLQERYQEWNKYFQDEDQLNAPWIAELALKSGSGQPLKAFQTQVDKLREAIAAGTLDLQGVLQEITTFNTKLKNLMAEELKASKDPRKKASGTNVSDHPQHYLAVNSEHMAEDQGRARLELRRIPAQTDLAKLFKDLAFIFGLISESRQRVGEQQKKRLQGK